MVVLVSDESNPTDGVVIGTYGTATCKQADRLYANDGTPTPLRARPARGGGAAGGRVRGALPPHRGIKIDQVAFIMMS